MELFKKICAVVVRRSWSRHVCGLVVFVVSLCQTAAADIEDEAFIFSARTLQRANAVIADIRRNTSPPKEISIRTIPSLPSNDPDARSIAERMFRDRRVKGVLLLVVRKPASVVLSSEGNILSKLKDSAKIQAAMLADFRAEHFESGLLNGLGMLQSELSTAFPLPKDSLPLPKSLFGKGAEQPAKASPVPAASPMSRLPSFSISNRLIYLLIGVSLWVLFPWRFFGGKLAFFTLVSECIVDRLSRFKERRGKAAAGPTARPAAKGSKLP